MDPSNISFLSFRVILLCVWNFRFWWVCSVLDLLCPWIFFGQFCCYKIDFLGSIWGIARVYWWCLYTTKMGGFVGVKKTLRNHLLGLKVTWCLCVFLGLFLYICNLQLFNYLLRCFCLCSLAIGHSIKSCVDICFCCVTYFLFNPFNPSKSENIFFVPKTNRDVM